MLFYELFLSFDQLFSLVSLVGNFDYLGQLFVCFQIL